jgi:hypothetical protein
MTPALTHQDDFWLLPRDDPLLTAKMGSCLTMLS